MEIRIRVCSNFFRFNNKYNIDCNVQQGVMSAGCFKNDIKDFEFEKNHLEKNYNYSELELIRKKFN